MDLGRESCPGRPLQGPHYKEHHMNRQQKRAMKAMEAKHEKTISRVTNSTQRVLHMLESTPLRMRLRTAWTLITKGRTRVERANRKALGLD